MKNDDYYKGAVKKLSFFYSAYLGDRKKSVDDLLL